MAGMGDSGLIRLQVRDSVVAVTLPCGDRLSVPLVRRRNPRARRAQIRVDAARRRISLTLPAGLAAAQGEAFLHRHGDWLARQLAALPRARPFQDGAEVPFRGQAHFIRHGTTRRTGIELAGGEIRVGCAPEFLERRVGDWLRAEARSALSQAAVALAAEAGLRPRRIAVRELHSRWGSCAPNGNLSFAWRLILAPPQVLTYVAAHEVAHLRHGNHGPDFWDLVRRLHPGADAARLWLRKSGPSLFAYGAAAD